MYWVLMGLISNKFFYSAANFHVYIEKTQMLQILIIS